MPPALPPLPSPRPPPGYMPAYHWDLVFLFSKLLQQLDKASQEDPVGIEEAVLDKGGVIYLCLQFLVSTEVQKLHCQQFILLLVLSAAIYSKAIFH